METRKELDNNYYLQIVSSTADSKEEIIDITKLRFIDFWKSKNLIFEIDFDKINEKKKKQYLKKLLRFVKIFHKQKEKIGKQNGDRTFLGYLVHYNERDEKQNDFILALNAIFYPSRYERYEYIYDTVCSYLDSYFYGKNLCDFHNNQCGEKRNTSSYTGCCHHFKHKWLGPLSKLVPCEYLKSDHTCGAKCISCKLFTCDYLEKKGVKFRIKDILLLDTFFNSLQKYFIKYMVFTPKEKIIKRLMIT